jgi:hypothetical protein
MPCLQPRGQASSPRYARDAERRSGVAESFVEYREISVADPLRQGDVLEAEDPQASRWQRHLFVVTADCDFAYGKHQGRVTCVPLMNAEEYLVEMQVPRIREKLVTKLLDALLGAAKTSGHPHVSSERLRQWSSESEPAEIIAALGLSGGQVATAQSALTSLRLADRSSTSFDEAIDRLIEAHLSAPNAQSRENVTRRIIESLRAPYVQPPGDALFLSALAPSHTDGYFAYLRHLEQILQSDIALGPTRSGIRYRRISRLRDRYIHALVQRFALVFLPIGLPREYEDIRDLHAELLGEKFS